MDDEFSDYGFEGGLSYFNRFPSAIRSALTFAVPFIIVDFFNYYSAGTALIFSTPVLALLYTGCGVLGCKYARTDGRSRSDYLYVGATSGLALWLTSTVVNTIISLIIGTATLGTTLLLGIPYLCLCAPFHLVGAGLMGALGGYLYRLSSGGSEDMDYPY